MRDPRPADDEPLDPALDAITFAILDGGPVDWTSATDPAIASVSGELRLVADLASVHRSIAGQEADRATVAPGFPWRVGPLTLTSSLGRGTFGEVFRAWDNELHRDVAIKVLFSTRAAADDAARMREEGRLLARVRHPNVVTVFGVQPIDGRTGLVMEFIHGRTLAALAAEAGPMSAHDVRQIGLDLCAALDAVHAAGVLHRDIKPQNVMRDENGRIVLMDFGAGRAADDAVAMAGTPLYLAPEVLNGAPASRASDIYSLGVLLFHLLTGGYPVRGASTAEIREAHREKERVRLRALRPDLPVSLAQAIDTATEPDPAARHAGAGAFRRACASTGRATMSRRAWLLGAAAVTIVGTLAWGAWPSAPLPAAGEPSAVASRVTLPPFASIGGPSSDGRYFAYTDASGHAWLWTTGTADRRKVVDGSTRAERVDFLRLSPDGSRLAYTAFKPDDTAQLRIADTRDRWPAGALDPSPDITLLSTRGAWAVPVDWSRDGSTLLAMLYRDDGQVEMLAMASNGSQSRHVATFAAPLPRRVSLSPDGRFVAYDAVTGAGPERDIFIAPVDRSGPPARVAGGTSSEEQPVWSFDGSALLVNSNRGGTFNLWRVPMRDGRAAGSPQRIASGTEDLTPFGTTADGDYYYALQTQRERLWTVPIDAAGVAAGPPVEVRGDATFTRRSPAWSPDGRTLAHFTIRGMNMYDLGGYLTMQTTDGARRHLTLPLLFFGGAAIRWAPDNHGLLIRGRRADGYFAYNRFDLQTGELTALVKAEPRGKEDALGMSPGWTSGGESIVWTTGDAITERVLASGRQRVLLQLPPGEQVTQQLPSPVDRRIAFSKIHGKDTVLAVREEDGTIRELLREPRAGSIFFVDWTADATQLVYALIDQNWNPHLWRIAAAGGTPVDMKIALEPGRIRVALRPDGRAVTYSTGSTAFELWMMRGIAR